MFDVSIVTLMSTLWLCLFALQRGIPGQPGQKEAVLLCLKLTVNFLFNTYFRTKTKLR